jgi:diguanylate cyclase (GGDEF)-like protein/PAS domain S-box-containing protein
MTNARILIAEDEAIVAEDLKQMLLSLGYDVPAVVRTGEEVIGKTAEVKPDLILMDIPLDGGIRAAEIVHDRFDIPVIFLTSCADVDTFQRPKTTDPFAYLIKPCDSNRLHYAVELALCKCDLENQLKQRETLYRSILEASGVAMMIIKGDTTIAMVNNEFEQLSGYPKEEVENSKSWTEFFTGNELVTMEEFQRLRKKSFSMPSHHMTTFLDREGSAKVVYTYVKMIPDAWTCIVTMIDISDLKRAEDEIRKLNAELTRVNADLVREITERKKFEIKLKYQADHDSLTGLPNRNLFFDRLNQAFAFGKRHNNLLALMILDLDNFKRVNDTLGHLSGDLLLKEVAKRLLQCMRQYDTVARFGGDEFVIIVNDMTDIGDIVKFAGKVTSLFRQPFDILEKLTNVTVSLGVAVYPLQGTSKDGLLKMADMALYQAKATGKNNFCFFSEIMSPKIDERTIMKEKLHNALVKKEFLPHYQPRVDATSGKITGMEALMRWQPHEAPLVQATEFFSLLEESGLIVPVGEELLYTVCRQTKLWHDAGMPLLRVAVKVSKRQFQQENFPARVAEVLTVTGLDPRYLEIELSENIIMEDLAESLKKMRNMKEIGVTIIIDNFGTGYCSLSNLNLLPIDELKIDRSFVNGISSDPNDATVVSATIAMGHSLGKMIVAEGVESEDQYAFLAKHKCEEMQGYFISRPLPADDFERLVFRQQSLVTTLH